MSAAAQMLDLRAGVPNVTCAREKEINQFDSPPLSPPDRSFYLSRARKCQVGRAPLGRSKPQPDTAPTPREKRACNDR